MRDFSSYFQRDSLNCRGNT